MPETKLLFLTFFTSFPAPEPTKVSVSEELALTIWTIKMYCNLQVDIFITWSFPRIDLDPQVFLGLRFGFYSLIYDRFSKHKCLGGFSKHRSWHTSLLGIRFGFYLIYDRFPKHRCLGGFPKHRSWHTSLLWIRFGFYFIYDRFPKHRCLGGFPKHRSWPQVFLGFRFGFNLIYVRFPKHRCFGGFPKHRSWPTSLFRI